MIQWIQIIMEKKSEKSVEISPNLELNSLLTRSIEKILKDQ
jgi:hypothetical protein